MTKRGKQTAAANSTTHGLLAMLTINRDMKKQKAWHRHYRNVMNEIEPLGFLETMLAERVTLLSWRLRACAIYESAVIEMTEADFARKAIEDSWVDDDLARRLASVPSEKYAAKLIRYEGYVARQLDKAVKRLADLQQLRNAPTARVLLVWADDGKPRDLRNEPSPDPSRKRLKLTAEGDSAK